MTVLKLTKSKKAVLVIDDDGRTYITSVNFIQGLISGKAKDGFITTRRLPNSVSAQRFKPSELYDPDGIYEGNAAKTLELNNTNLTNANDALGVKSASNVDEKKGLEDKDVW